MTGLHADVLVLGSGFGGSLLSLILSQLGRKCVLVDKTLHPRFAIGESSTPLADFVLSDLARRYELPQVLPLASFGTWQEHHPNLRCGLKRGFTYFHHEPGREFHPDAENANQLLVAASSDDFDSDTHWHRADVDAWLFSQAAAAGVECLEDTTVCSIRDHWEVELKTPQGHVLVRCKHIIDGTGAAGTLLRHLKVPNRTDVLETSSVAVFGHFECVRPFSEQLGEIGVDTSSHPYACDHAALHHVGHHGWMWNLRFATGLTSAGVLFPSEPVGNTTPAEMWASWLREYPSVAAQFRDARGVPDVGLRRTARLQRLVSRAAGPGWFALPHTAGFIDPLHSTGIAHTLTAVERITSLFARSDTPTETDAAEYSAAILSELRFIDELVSGCYRSLGRPVLFNSWSMLYFAAAHACELRRLAGEREFANGFLGAHIGELREIVAELTPLLQDALNGGPQHDRGFENRVAEAIEPFNHAGLFRSDVPNMYANTAPPRGLGL